MPDVFVSEEVKTPINSKPVQLNATELKESKHLSFFSSFCPNPTGITFKNQEPDEKIALFLRRHFIKNINWILICIALALLPIFFLFPISLFKDFQNIIPINFGIIFLLFYYLLVFSFAYVNFVTWFYNAGIITNKQIIDIDFTDIMYREVAKAGIKDVIDVEFKQGGFMGSFFDYGDVFVQTEGIKPNFEFHSIPRPNRATDILIDLKGQYKK